MNAADAIVHRAEGQLLLRSSNVLVWVSRGRLEDAPLSRLRLALEELAAEHPEGVALLLVAVGESELPSLQTRRRIARGLASLGERVQCVAAAFEGERSWVVLVTGAIEGMLTMIGGAGTKLPMRAFGDREDAIVWLGEIVHGPDQRPIDTAPLAELVDDALIELA